MDGITATVWASQTIPHGPPDHREPALVLRNQLPGSS